MDAAPLIIEAALNGQTPKAANPHVPISDDEVVEQAVACMEAGAALIHTHTPEPIIGGPGRLDPELYATPWRRILEARPDAILTPTMPVGQEGVPVETRYAHIEVLAKRGLVAMGLCDPGTFNYSIRGEDGLFAPSTYLYRNDMSDSHYYVEACRRLSLGLSISIFEPGFVKFILAYVEAGRMPPGGLLKFYFGTNVVPFGLPPTETALAAYLEMIEGSGLPWLVSVFGDDCVDCGLAEQAILRGGHVQVGLEPLGGGNGSVTNEALVDRVAQIAHKHGRPLATPAEAAGLLQLPQFPVRPQAA
ncbi:MAG: 3-keto-5-aminohexanoate cleavage protein [Myxococcota bacterium]